MCGLFAALFKSNSKPKYQAKPAPIAFKAGPAYRDGTWVQPSRAQQSYNDWNYAENIEYYKDEQHYEGLPMSRPAGHAAMGKHLVGQMGDKRVPVPAHVGKNGRRY